MTKDVLIAIAGLQFEVEDNGSIEMITSGEYYNKGNKHYILYEEVLEEDRSTTKNTIKISDQQIDILRKGPVNVHMTFEENKKNMTYYDTPFGQLLIGLDTYKIHKKVDEEQIQVIINYGLEINYSHVSNCEIKIDIKSKQGSSFAEINL